MDNGNWRVPTPREVDLPTSARRGRPRRSKYDALLRDIFMRLEKTRAQRALAYEFASRDDVIRVSSSVYNRLKMLDMRGALSLRRRGNTLIVAHGTDYDRLPPDVADVFVEERR